MSIEVDPQEVVKDHVFPTTHSKHAMHSCFIIEKLAQVEAQRTSPKEVLGKGLSLN